MTERYTPGHTDDAVRFMARRTLESHGAFFVPHIPQEGEILDCGCGPGTITCDIAERAPAARVVGVDAADSQSEAGQEQAVERKLSNARFEQADVYELPFEDDTFAAVFSHALFEHLGEPLRAMREIYRVAAPGCVIGICTPDWGGVLLAPISDDAEAAIESYKTLQSRGGGDVYAGRKLAVLASDAGFVDAQLSARYEVYPSRELIAEYLALQLDGAGEAEHAAALRKWSREPGSLYAQPWLSCIAHKKPL